MIDQGVIDICSITYCLQKKRLEVDQLINFWKCKFWKYCKVSFALLVVKIEEEMFCHD